MSEFNALFKISGPSLERDEITVTSAGYQVGRSGANDLALPHSEISRNHLRLFPHEGGFAVEDLKSSNGVWVNDVRIRSQTPHPIKPGDVLRAGPYLFTFDRIIEVVGEGEPLAQGVTPESPPASAEHSTTPPAEAQQTTPPKPRAVTQETAEEKEEKKPQRKEEAPAKPAPVAASEPPVIERVERIDAAAFIPRTDGDGLARLQNIPPDLTLPPVETNGHKPYPIGIPTDASNWLKYLPAIYADDEFLGRYLLVFESIFSPITWMVDNFDMYLSPEVTSSEWLRWIAGWFDVLIVPELPLERQRALVEQLGWLYSRRGTRGGLERLLTLYYGVKPEITEEGDCHFTVKMPLSDSSVKLEADILDRLIMAHKPAHASYTLEVI